MTPEPRHPPIVPSYGAAALADLTSSILASLDPGAPEVTFRHLLTHTAGIGELPRIGDVTSRTAWGSGRPYAPASDLAALYRGVLRTEVPAGSKWAYANHGFAVLGQLVEDMAGGPFAEHMREHVLQPLGMANTDYVRSERVSDALATGYHWMFGRFRPLKDYDLTLLGPGSVLSSVNDMARYAEWLAHGNPDVDLAVAGAERFRALGCSGCHGANASVRAPKLDGLFGHPVQLADGRTVIADERYIRDSVLLPQQEVVAGYAPIMPSYQGQVSEEDLLALLAYVKSLANAPAPVR